MYSQGEVSRCMAADIGHASFWIRPEYVVNYRPILDAPVDAAGEVVEEIMLCCC